MYLKKLDLESLFFNDNYNKVSTYANVKRAQVTLVEEMSKQEKWRNTKIFCMHPGWVYTEGLKISLPNFFSLMKNKLRNLEEGSDTILWLLLTEKNIKSGGFYFDRQISGQLVNPKNIAVKGPSKDDSVITSLFTSINENSEPLNFDSMSSLVFSIDKKTGNNKNKKITFEKNRRNIEEVRI